MFPAPTLPPPPPPNHHPSQHWFPFLLFIIDLEKKKCVTVCIASIVGKTRQNI